MEELKKCPFCGGKAKIDSEYCFTPTFYNPDGRDGVIMPYVKCKKCGVTTKLYSIKEKAIEAWNRRVENMLKQEKK